MGGSRYKGMEKGEAAKAFQKNVETFFASPTGTRLAPYLDGLVIDLYKDRQRPAADLLIKKYGELEHNAFGRPQLPEAAKQEVREEVFRFLNSEKQEDMAARKAAGIKTWGRDDYLTATVDYSPRCADALVLCFTSYLLEPKSAPRTVEEHAGVFFESGKGKGLASALNIAVTRLWRDEDLIGRVLGMHGRPRLEKPPKTGVILPEGAVRVTREALYRFLTSKQPFDQAVKKLGGITVTGSGKSMAVAFDPKRANAVLSYVIRRSLKTDLYEFVSKKPSGKSLSFVPKKTELPGQKAFFDSEKGKELGNKIDDFISKGSLQLPEAAAQDLRREVYSLLTSNWESDANLRELGNIRVFRFTTPMTVDLDPKMLDAVLTVVLQRYLTKVRD